MTRATETITLRHGDLLTAGGTHVVQAVIVKSLWLAEDGDSLPPGEPDAAWLTLAYKPEDEGVTLDVGQRVAVVGMGEYLIEPLRAGEFCNRLTPLPGDARERAALNRELQRACAERDMAAVGEALAAGADPFALVPGYGTDGAFLHVAERGHVGLLAHMMILGVEVGGSGADGQSALHAAAAFGTPASVEFLLAAGADPAARDGEGRTPLDLARAWLSDSEGRDPSGLNEDDREEKLAREEVRREIVRALEVAAAGRGAA